MGAAVSKFWVAAVVAACVAPSAAANVVPRLTHLFDPTAAVWLEFAVVALLVMSVITMARIPFFIENTRNYAWRSIAVVTAVALGCYNYTQAHETIGRLWEYATAPASATAAKRAALDSRIERARTAAAQLPQLPQTSAAEAAAANQAVALAEADVAKECVIVKDNCRLRQADLREAVAGRGKAPSGPLSHREAGGFRDHHRDRQQGAGSPGARGEGRRQRG